MRFSQTIVFLAICMLIATAGIILHDYSSSPNTPKPNPSIEDDPLSALLEMKYGTPVMATAERHGFPVTPVELLPLLKDIDVSALQSRNPKVAICMQDLSADNDWSNLQVQGIQFALSKFGIAEPIITDGEFDIEKQLADYRNVIALEPDLMITIPLDNERMAPLLKQAAEQGIKLILIDNVPDDFTAPKDFASFVIADSYANGYAAIDILAERLGPDSKIALIHWAREMLTTDNRSRAARAAVGKFKNLTLVEEVTFENVRQVPQLTRTLLTDHPDLDGIWVVWDAPALKAAEVIREMNRDVVVTTIDLGRTSAALIAKDDIIIGTGAQHPYQQGVAEGLAAVLALAGITPPPYIVVPGERVTSETMQESWKNVFHTPYPVAPKTEADLQ